MAGKLTRDDLLVLLIEECGEVIQAATKCLRFGFNVDHETGYGNNSHALARECGDLQAIMDALPLNPEIKASTQDKKLAKAAQVKCEYPRRALEQSKE